MELTGKCNEDFKKYIVSLKTSEYNQYYYCFDDLTNSMKFGVYKDFFEHHKIYINISNDFYKNGVNHLWQVFVYDNTQPDFLSNLSTGGYGDNGEYDKDTSRIKSVEAANEIYNKLNI